MILTLFEGHIYVRIMNCKLIFRLCPLLFKYCMVATYIKRSNCSVHNFKRHNTNPTFSSSFFFLSIFHLNVSCLSGCCFCLSFYNFGRSMSSFETETHVWVFFWIGLSVFSLEVSVKGQHEDLSRQQELAWLKTACEELALPGGVTLETGHSTAHSAPDNTASATRKQHPYGRVNDQETTPVWQSQRPGNYTRMAELMTRKQHPYGGVNDQETTPVWRSQRPGNNTRMVESTTRNQHLYG